jgi:hypothetical protein
MFSRFVNVVQLILLNKSEIRVSQANIASIDHCFWLVKFKSSFISCHSSIDSCGQNKTSRIIVLGKLLGAPFTTPPMEKTWTPHSRSIHRPFTAPFTKGLSPHPCAKPPGSKRTWSVEQTPDPGRTVSSSTRFVDDFFSMKKKQILL